MCSLTKGGRPKMKKKLITHTVTHTLKTFKGYYVTLKFDQSKEETHETNSKEEWLIVRNTHTRTHTWEPYSLTTTDNSYHQICLLHGCVCVCIYVKIINMCLHICCLSCTHLNWNFFAFLYHDAQLSNGKANARCRCRCRRLRRRRCCCCCCRQRRRCFCFVVVISAALVALI